MEIGTGSCEAESTPKNSKKSLRCAEQNGCTTYEKHCPNNHAERLWHTAGQSQPQQKE